MREILIKSLDDTILPSIMAGSTPEDAIIKHAKKANWSPALVEAMGQLFNTAKTLTVFEKSASRGATFSVIDVPNLVVRFMKSEFPDVPVHTKSASVAVKSASVSLGQFARQLKPTMLDMVKSAKAAPASKPVEVTIDMVKRAIAERDEAVFDLREEVNDLFVKLAFMHKQGQINLPTLASDFAAAVESESLAMEQIKRAMQGIIRYGVKLASVEVVPSKLAMVNSRQPGFAELALLTKKLATLSRFHKMASIEAKQKAAPKATGAEEKPQKFRPDEESLPSMDQLFTGNAANIPASQEAGKRDSKEVGPDWVGDIGKMLGAWAEPVRTGVGHAQEAFGGGANSGQQLLDTDMEHTRQTAMLQKLMLTDDVLSEADPTKLLEKFETLRRTMPSFAADPNVMRVSLRSAMQGDGISPFDVKQLLDVEGAAQKTDSAREARDSAEYARKPFKKPKEEAVA